MANAVITAMYASTSYLYERKVCRTSDGTIHVLIQARRYVYHRYSYNQGTSWNSLTTWDFGPTEYDPYYCGIDVDPNDNLIAVCSRSPGSIRFKKAIVNKTGSPWTWSWGSEILVANISDGWDPDILSDSNGYYHAVYERTTGNSEWARSVDGGQTWTRTSTFSSYTRNSIVKDSANNLYLFSFDQNDGKMKGRKVTYNGGTSWSLGGITTIDTSGSIHASLCLNDDRLCLIYQRGGSGCYFKRSTNPSDITTWDNYIILETSIYSSTCLALGQNVQNKVYSFYRGTYSGITGIYYKVSNDNGVTFGSRRMLSSMIIISLNCSRYRLITDIVWAADAGGGNRIIYQEKLPLIHDPNESLSLNSFLSSKKIRSLILSEVLSFIGLVIGESKRKKEFIRFTFKRIYDVYLNVRRRKI